MEKRRMCPNCRAFVTTADKVCPYCDVQLGLTYRQKTSDVAGLIPRDRLTTVIILGVNTLMYAAMMLHALNVLGSQSLMDFPGRTLVQFGAKEPLRIAGGEWWRYVTAGFLHGGLIHFAMNSWVLMDLGRQVEEFFGTSRFLVIYFVSSIAGFALSNWWSYSISVGASAAIFGLVGGMLGLGLRSKTSLGAEIRDHFGRWAIYGLLMSFLPMRIDIAAHVGGLLAGIAIGYLADRPKLADNAINKMWRFAAAACVVITFCSFALVFLRFAAR